MSRKRLGEMLVDAGLVSEQQLRVALKEQQRWGGSLGRTVVEMKLVGESDLVRVLAEQLKVAAIDLDALEIPQSVLAWVTADMADLHAIVPYAQPMKFLDIAMADPTNITVLDELRTRTKLNIRPALAGPKMIERAIGKYYGRGFSRFYGDIPLALDSEGPALEVEKSDNEPMLDDLLVEDRDPGVKLKRPAPARASPMPVMPPPSPHAAPPASPSSPPAPPAASMRPPMPRATGPDTAGLERRIADLEARVAKQDAIITKLVSALVEHGLGDRADLLR
jgi:Type II secretion system (T2SS), protein E, N-terminal domain